MGTILGVFNSNCTDYTIPQWAIKELYKDNGKENGSYRLGFRA